MHNSKEIATELLQRESDVTVMHQNGNTRHLAARYNRREIVVDLLQRGADINVVNMDGDTPLHLAARFNSKETAAELNSANNDGDFPLYNSKEIAAKLIQRGADVNAVNKDGNTPLHWAAVYNNKDIATELIQCRADVNVVNKDGNTPIHLASEWNSKETASELLQCGADVDVVNMHGDTALHVSARNNSKEVAAELFQRGTDVNVTAVNKDGDTPLHWAARNNSIEIAAELLKRGADVNAVNKDDNTPLHWAARNNSKEIVDELLQRHAVVAAVNIDGNTPLHWSVWNNSKAITADLLQHGADVTVSNKDGNTPLHWSVWNNSKELTAELIQRGADVDAVNKDGNTPFHLATENNSQAAAAILLQHGADVIAVNKGGNTPLDIAYNQIDRSMFSNICQTLRWPPIAMNNFGETAFHISAKFSIREILDLSECSGFCKEAILNGREYNGNSPLHCWAMVSEEQITEYGQSLIEMGGCVNARNNQDQTPLHVTTSWEAAVVLLENGAWPNVTSACSGDTPLLTRVKSLERSSHEVYKGFCVQHNSTVDTSNASAVQEWQEIVRVGMDPWITNHNGESVLYLLIKNKSFLLASALISFLKIEAASNNKHTNGETILHIICASDTDELQDVMDNLLKTGVRVNCTNSAKETPLHLVCKRISDISNGKQDIINTMFYWKASRLLAYGADPNLRDSRGTTCVDIAEGTPQLLDLLKQPIDISAIPPLLKWSEPKSEVYRSKLAQVVRNQNSSQIDSYHYHKKPIGSGAFAHVFAGVDESNGREVAVKRIERQRLIGSEARREITNLVMLRDCEEVVKYLGHYVDTHFVFLFLDLMEGTLNEYLDKFQRNACLDVTLCRDVVKGLQFLHQNNVLHRDIKPGNILYKLFPRACLKLADFGLSTKSAFNASLQTATVMHPAAGTRCWMAPELLKATEQNNHSEASDVFACGLVLHFLLANKRHPFTQPSKTARGGLAEQNETERNIMHYKPFLHKDLSPEARDLLEKMLDEDNDKRPQTTEVLPHPIFWSKAKTIMFVCAVGNQPEIKKPRHKVTTLSPLELQLENTLGNDFATIGWQNSISTVYAEMTGPGRRSYKTSSAVELLRFVRNCHAHASDRNHTAAFQKDVMTDCVLFNKFPSLLIEVYKAVKTHGWDKRVEIETALKME